MAISKEHQDQWLKVSPPDQELVQFLEDRLPPELFVSFSYSDDKSQRVESIGAALDAFVTANDPEDIAEGKACDALARVLSQKYEHSDRQFYFRGIARYDDAYLFVALVEVDAIPILNAAYLNYAWPFLTSYHGEGHRQPWPPASLPVATIDQLLTEFMFALGAPSRSGSTAVRRDASEIARSAARRLIGGLLSRVATESTSLRDEHIGAGALLEACTALSAMRYERLESSGAFLITPWSSDDSSVTAKFVEPIELTQTRKVRKLLEMAQDGSALVCDGRSVIGVARAYQEAVASTTSIFSVSFTGDHTWELIQAHRSVMRVQHGLPMIVKPRLDDKEYQAFLKRVFPDIDSADADLLGRITIAGSRTRKGTTVVIASSAHSEAQRLGKQALALRPFRPSVAMAESLMSIDGAILLDPQGFCHAAGVILDGLASPKGNAARGSRYNSAVRYMESMRNQACLIAVCSEDGTVDLVSTAVPIPDPASPARPVPFTILSPRHFRGTSYWERSNSEIRDAALQLAQQIRSLVNDINRDHEASSKLKGELARSSENDNERRTLYQELAQAESRGYSEAQERYASSIRVDAILIHEELERRVPKPYRRHVELFDYDRPVNTFGYEAIAADLERLAGLLRV